MPEYTGSSQLPVIRTHDNITLSEEQTAICLALENTTDNYFITGKAGTGKSVLLRGFIDNTKKTVAVVAPTGIAAINVGGQTTLQSRTRRIKRRSTRASQPHAKSFSKRSTRLS